MSERLYSTFQIADLLDVPSSDVVQWIEKGWLDCRQLANGPRVTEDAVLDFLKQRGVDIESVMARAALRAGRKDPDTTPEPDPDTTALAETTQPTPDDPKAASDAAEQIAAAILRDGVARGVDAIHLEPQRDGLALRLRIHGVLHDKVNFRLRLPKAATPALIDKLKSMAGLDLTRRASPQDGSFAQTIEGREIRFRVALLPTRHGERAVVHVLDPDRPPPDLPRLLAGDDLIRVQDLLAEPCGLIMVVAPGRRTRSAALRAMVNALNSRERNVLAVEVSPGPTIEGVSQALVRPGLGYALADAVAAAALQDADVIVVEEVQDAATAGAAVELAAEGRMVLAGMPARDPGTALATFSEMCGRPGLLSSSLLAITEHRTLRQLCDDCKTAATPSPEQLACIGMQDLADPVHAAAGCAACANTGYAGAASLSTIIEVDQGLARAIRLGRAPSALEGAAWLAGAKSLRAVARTMLKAGAISVEEIARVLPFRRAAGSGYSRPNGMR